MRVGPAGARPAVVVGFLVFVLTMVVVGVAVVPRPLLVLMLLPRLLPRRLPMPVLPRPPLRPAHAPSG